VSGRDGDAALPFLGRLVDLIKGNKLGLPRFANCLVIAAVNVVFPWSMCPMVPTFTCGFFRSYFFFAISLFL
jgi:hypothetical protein